MREVADRAGVAISSVSRTLAGHPDVSPEMRDRVLGAVQELGYKPDLLAQGLRNRATRSIGFVAGDVSNPVVAHIVKGAETTLRDAGYSMLLTNSLVEPHLDRENIELLEQRRADGMIVLPVREDYQPTIDALARLDVPLVVVDRDLPARVQASRVLSDHAIGMREAAEHLLELGHRRLGMILGQPSRPTRERRAAVEAVLAEHGLGSDQLIVCEGVYSVEHGARATEELLDLPHPPTALIAGGNQLMIGSLEVVADREVGLGRTMSFLGCDDAAIAKLCRPQIAVVDRDAVALGRAAAELVLAHLHDEMPVQETVLPTTFVPRPSCGPAPPGP